MDKDPKAGGRKPVPGAADDAWDSLARVNRAESFGENPIDALLGDTGRHLRGDRTEALQIEGPGPSTEILQLVNESLASEPERADLWTMRFEVQKTLGLKREFAEAMAVAFRNPRLWRQLDWNLIGAMWREVAPGEALPEGVRLPEPVAQSQGSAPAITTAPGTARDRRFSDVANRIASRELAVLAKAWAALQARPGFLEEFARKVAPLLRRPTPLHLAENLTRIAGNANTRIFLKREDRRAVTPEQENATAQCYVAALMGRPTVITGNDVDAHALALAEVAPRFSLRCIVVVRPADLDQKTGLIGQLRAHGAQVEAMDGGGLGGDPREGAVRLWLKSMGYAHLALSLGTGPSPYPAMVNNFQSLLGRETELQLRATAGDGRERTLVAAVQSEADSIGFMLPQLGRTGVELMYAEPDPGGISSWRPSARLRAYNGAVREHAWLRGLGRVEHVAIPDAQAAAARQQLERAEGVVASLEDARAVALAALLAQRDRAPRDYVVLVA
jgi:tryptophan synthase beta chain